MRRIVVLILSFFLFAQTVYSQEKVELLMGKVEHTSGWEENRNRFNDHCMKEGRNHQIRPKDMFWSGEKFMVTAHPNGEKMPVSVDVEIIGTEFTCRLMKTTDGYQGEIFDPDMIGKWGQEKPEELEFRFSAYIDGKQREDIQRITLNDLEKYWLMHRKE